MQTYKVASLADFPDYSKDIQAHVKAVVLVKESLLKLIKFRLRVGQILRVIFSDPPLLEKPHKAFQTQTQ